MLLQPSLRNRAPSISPSLSCPHPLQSKISQIILRRSSNPFKPPAISCSVSQVHSYNTVDYERRPMVKWNAVFKRISLMESPELGAATVLNQCEDEGKKLTKWELCRVVKELRKYKRYKPALEVYDWMNNRGERFRLAASDAAIQLDLIAKVHGISDAEDFFLKLPDTLKDRRIYGALLNAYVRAKMKEKAESLIDTMREKGHAMHALPFNVMMTLYMNLKDYGKVDALVSEMMEKNIQLDMYSYNIWLSSRGSQGSVEGMEQVFDQMKRDSMINPNWTTFSTMATMYIKMGQLEKAEDCLKKVESRITGRDRIPYHYLISLYGTVGNKEETYRVWNTYKSVFPTIPNLGYHAMISSLVRIGDIEGAEKMYEEWLLVRTSFDPRIGNLLMSFYVKERKFDKAEGILDQMVELGGKPNSSTWEILAEGHTGERRISEAFSCFKEAFLVDGSKSWRPKPVTVSYFFDLCKEEGNLETKEALVGLLRQSGFLEDKTYASFVGLSNGQLKDEAGSQDEGDGSEVLLDQLQGSM
ncbi:pentatricopeptide repeat-containing protein At1g02150 [Rhodamnia argentea]|uniref:Pentatricopeptide repeat-containing protein At1g02150 n=1 Tax=Rhodamnia argentea TaxID=178133 RepID=A0A8B8MRT9_9MYRT|nr:pentatricopeptide repeat-containing protein At1g02150 [Rhodamnia argentea]